MGHINPATGRNKRDKLPPVGVPSTGMRPVRRNGKILDRAASQRKLKVERELRKRGRK
jgi:hypothetical protein